MRKEADEKDRSRANIILNPGHDRLNQDDLSSLLAHLKRGPHILRQQFSPVLQQLKKQFPNHQKLQVFLERYLPNPERVPLIANHQHLVHNFAEIMQRKVVVEQLDILGDRSQVQSRKPVGRRNQQQEQTIQKIEMLYPDYDSYFKMSKQQKSHLTQYHPKTKNKDFFTEPRFLVRIEEFQHFRNNDQYKGDIIYLQYQGNTIASSKAHLVANQKALELWATESNNYPIPNLNIPTEEELEKKKEEEKKEKEKQPEEVPVLSPLKFEFQHKFLGHTEKITSISLSQDEYYAISGSADRTIRLWCLRLKICLAVYRGHTKSILDVHFSPSGYYFLSGSMDGLMMLWKTDEPHAQRAFYHQAEIYKVSFAKDPAYVVSAGEDACIKIWAVSDAALLRKISLNEPVVNFTLGFSGAYLIAVEADGKISLLDLLRGTTINSFYFEEPQRRRKVDEKEKQKLMKIHDVCLSEDERELSCVCGHYVVVYSMDKIEKKLTSNIFTFYKNTQEVENVVVLQPKEILYLGGDTNLTHCSYQSKNVLVVAGTYKQ